MSELRADLTDVVWVRVKGQLVAIGPGDKVPAGVKLDPRLLKAAPKPRTAKGKGKAREDAGDGERRAAADGPASE